MSISPQENLQGIEDTPNPFHYPEYPHHGYYPHHAHHAQQNSPYFPASAAAAAAMYQPHFHHYHHHHVEAVAPSDYSPGSEASNEYFYAGNANAGGSQSYPQNNVAGSSFHFDSSDSR